MGSSKRYPSRLYGVGNFPLPMRSMHHDCSLSNLGGLKGFVGDEVYDKIRKNSQLGVLLDLAESDYLFCGKTIHYLLSNQLAINIPSEVWFLVGGKPLRFSLYEYEEISGLNCEKIDETEFEVDHTPLWAALKVKAFNGPNWEELVEGLRSCRGWSDEMKTQIARLYLVHVGVLGLSRNSRIPLEYAKRALNEEAFESFQWGRVGFKSLVDSIKVLGLPNNAYTLHGCVHVLLIWAFESVKVLGASYGNVREGVDLPLLRWRGGRPRKDIEAFISGSKLLNNGELQVKHLVPKPLEFIYPDWPGQYCVYGVGEGLKKKLDNLLLDVINGEVDEREWDCVKKRKGEHTKKRERRQHVAGVSDDDFLETAPTSIRNVPNNAKEQKESVGDKCSAEKASGDNYSGVQGEDGSGRLFTMVETLGAKMDNIQISFSRAIAEVVFKLQGMESRMGNFESDVQLLKKVVINTTDGGAHTQGPLTLRNDEQKIEEIKHSDKDGYKVASCVRNPLAIKDKVMWSGSIKIEPEDSVERIPKQMVDSVQRVKRVQSWETEEGDKRAKYNDKVDGAGAQPVPINVIHPVSGGNPGSSDRKCESVVDLTKGTSSPASSHTVKDKEKARVKP
ncbi:PREDICTED: uncharacterized protein LOC104751261 [Camelina sativa]|uniref:Uncharacterized protein LOC104751261 n=3 Tax=Camelina sativa TaxID=90675 RepID=A0ABM0WIB6_CAMSA|nr:PREDICTED: uncharacterized protein LOC104751261 [Camelina sativa]